MLKKKTEEEMNRLWDADTGETIHPDEFNKVGVPDYIGLIMKVNAIRLRSKNKKTGQLETLYQVSSNALKRHILGQVKKSGYEYIRTLGKPGGLLYDYKDFDTKMRSAWLISWCSDQIVYVNQFAYEYLTAGDK